jgi:hypothetical protein
MKLLRYIMRIPNNHISLLILSFFALCSSSCNSNPQQGSVVTIIQTETGYQMIRNGSPFTIHGVGGTTNLKKLKEYGGNTIRTWDAEGIEPLMDEASELGIAVVVGIWLEHTRHGFDSEDPEKRKEQLERVEGFVHQFKDHPALLAWGVGNEVELGVDLDIAIIQINEAAKMIKSIDQSHPTMAVIAEIGDDKAVRISNECPDIDMLGINSYGGMGSVADRALKQGYTGPFAITEFGPVGHWETGLSPWGAPYEQSSHDKAQFTKMNYISTIESNLGKQCLGSFGFLWGNKQEKTATWYGLLLESGETTESVDVLSELWTGQTPLNRAPQVKKMNLNVDPGTMNPGQRVTVNVDAFEPDGDPMNTQWSVIPESDRVSAGGDFEDYIQPSEIEIEVNGPTSAIIELPDLPGAYRIFAIVRDGQGHAGTVNLPILIVEE